MLLQPNPLLWRAIEDRRMIRLLYHRRNRILEPHDHGILNGSVQLLAYQVGGSSSRPLPNWILMKANEIVDLELLARGEGHPLWVLNVNYSFAAASSVAMSNFTIFIIAAIALGCFRISPIFSGTICQHRPNLSVSQPQAIGLPPSSSLSQ